MFVCLCRLKNTLCLSVNPVTPPSRPPAPPLNKHTRTHIHLMSRVSVRALPLAQHQTQGLTVYCAVSLLKTYSCSVATFSPPGVGLVILPPIDAPLQLVETFYPGSCGDVSGCSPPHEETLAAAEPNADILLGEKSVRSSQGQYGREGIPGGGGALSPAMGVSEGAEAVPIGGDATGATEGGKGGGGVYAGKILVVARGDCTFEQKVSLCLSVCLSVCLSLSFSARFA